MLSVSSLLNLVHSDTQDCTSRSLFDLVPISKADNQDQPALALNLKATGELLVEAFLFSEEGLRTPVRPLGPLLV